MKGEQTFCLASLQDRRSPSVSPSLQEAQRPTGPITKAGFWVSLAYVDPSCSIARAVPRPPASQHPCDFPALPSPASTELEDEQFVFWKVKETPSREAEEECTG